MLLASACSAQRVNIRGDVRKRSNIKHYTYNFFLFSKFPWFRTWRLKQDWVKVLLKFGCTIYTNRCQSSSNKQDDDLEIEKKKNKKLRCVPPWTFADATAKTTISFNFVGYPYIHRNNWTSFRGKVHYLKNYKVIDLLLGTINFTAWKLSKYGVFSAPYFPLFRLNTKIYGVNLHIRLEYRKIRTRKISVFGHFSRSV